MSEDQPARVETNPLDDIATLKEQYKRQRREITHLKSALKKAKYRINALKIQKQKLLKKINPPPKPKLPQNNSSHHFFK